MQIERLSPHDVGALHEVWEAAFAPTWSLPKDSLAATLAAKTILVASEKGSIAGFLAFEQRETTASIAAIAVRPDRQNRGLGKALLREALAELDRTGIKTVRAGAGCGAYFWPGIPDTLGPARRLFDSAGFEPLGPCHDLGLPLQSFDGTVAPLDGIKLRSATTDLAAAVVAFQQAHFPIWVSAYGTALQTNRGRDVALACDADGDIFGTALLFAAGDYLWSVGLGSGVGGFGKVGVRADRRRQGLGLALAAKATAMLKERAFRYAVVDWTDRPDWYGHLGYEITQTYVMATRHGPHKRRL